MATTQVVAIFDEVDFNMITDDEALLIVNDDARYLYNVQYRFLLFEQYDESFDGLNFGTVTINDFSSLEAPGVKRALDSALDSLLCLIREEEYARIFYIGHRDQTANGFPLLWPGTERIVGRDVLEYITAKLHEIPTRLLNPDD